MLFNSYIFIFIFLPIVLFGFYAIGARSHHRAAIAWLVAASLFFYGWWNPAYLSIILISMLFNYAVGAVLSGKDKSKLLLALSISINLLVLAYYKYFNFFIENINNLGSTDFNFEKIVLPLAISFFTFQQVAYLIDAYRGETREYNFLSYCLFVTFFPQLIAGPIVHHREMLPQFAKETLYKINYRHLVIGLSIFTLGFFKKSVLADGTSEYVNLSFNLAETSTAITFFAAWAGSLCYAFQLYFDFSGYSDMAIGLARMFGIVLPMNFNSPYKSQNITLFWRRWHMTLSRFLRDYLYIPLGGNRKGKTRQLINLMLTMVLGGFWHGAGWNFALWGFLHGAFLIMHNSWMKLSQIFGVKMPRFIAWWLTFSAVLFAWVPFRATSLDGAFNLWRGMLGINGWFLPQWMGNYAGYFEQWAMEHHIVFVGIFHQVGSVKLMDVLWFVMLFIIAFYLPNTQQFMQRYHPVFESSQHYKIPALKLYWRPSLAWSMMIAFLFVYATLSLTRISEFLYFQF
ncbi:MAG: MBOAT family protein [Methylococcaceae bacterium]|nr:MBOAT family protein [Methylococcaceae bacterium]